MKKLKVYELEQPCKLCGINKFPEITNLNTHYKLLLLMAGGTRTVIGDKVVAVDDLCFRCWILLSSTENIFDEHYECYSDKQFKQAQEIILNIIKDKEKYKKALLSIIDGSYLPKEFY